MKTSIMIAGVCLLALTSTITEALDKRQNVECLSPSSAVQSCVTQLASQSTSICSGSCRDTLLEYYSDCGIPRAAFDLLCDSIEDGGNNNCLTPSSSLRSCLTQLASQSTSVCSGSCRDTLLEYYSDCGIPRAAFDLLCDSIEDGGNNNCLTPSSSLRSCLTQLASQSTSVCSGSCRDTLLEYYSDCGIPRAAFDLLCDSIEDGGNNNCLTPSSSLRSCLTQLASQSTSVCSGTCRDTLLEYYSDCGIPRAAFNLLCDSIEDGGNNNCLTPSSSLRSCLTQLASQSTSVCSGSCRDTLLEYYSDCSIPRAAFDLVCDAIDDGGDNDGGDNDGGDNDGGDNDGGDNGGVESSAATVGVTLFTIVSAALVAVGN